MVKKSFLISLLVLASCGENVLAPKGIIPKDTMALVLIDVHLAEAKVTTENLSVDTAQVYYDILRKEVYKKHHITNDRFQKSMSYYSQNVKELDKIYEVVIDSLGLKESRGKLE